MNSFKIAAVLAVALAALVLVASANKDSSCRAHQIGSAECVSCCNQKQMDADDMVLRSKVCLCKARRPVEAAAAAVVEEIARPTVEPVEEVQPAATESSVVASDSEPRVVIAEV